MHPYLPLEIIWQILEYAQYDNILPKYKWLKAYSLVSKSISSYAQYDNILPKYKWLKAYSLVSKSISSYAQTLLFRHVILKGSKAAQVFKTSLASSPVSRNTILRNSVRTFILRNMDHQEIFGEILSSCPQIRHLDLQIFHASFRDHVLSLFSSSLTSLVSLKMWSLSVKPVIQLIHIFAPTLQHLSIDWRQSESSQNQFFVPPTSSSESPSAPQQRLKHLTELRLRAFWFRDNTGSAFTHVTSFIPIGNLTILHLFDMPPIVQFKRWLEQGHAVSLRSLQFRRYTFAHLVIFTYCPKLEELQVLAPLTKELVDVLPRRTLVHLSVYCPGGITKDVAVPSYIRSLDEDDVLKILSYHFHSASEGRRTETISIRNLCRECGVEFRYFHIPLGQYQGEEEPMTPAIFFPRPTPVSYKERKSTLNMLCSKSQVTEGQKKPSVMRRMGKVVLTAVHI